MSYSARRDAPSLRACSKSFLALLSSSLADAASTYSTLYDGKLPAHSSVGLQHVISITLGFLSVAVEQQHEKA